MFVCACVSLGMWTFSGVHFVGPRDKTQVPSMVARVFTSWAILLAPNMAFSEDSAWSWFGSYCLVSVRCCAPLSQWWQIIIANSWLLPQPHAGHTHSKYTTKFCLFKPHWLAFLALTFGAPISHVSRSYSPGISLALPTSGSFFLETQHYLARV